MCQIGFCTYLQTYFFRRLWLSWYVWANLLWLFSHRKIMILFPEDQSTYVLQELGNVNADIMGQCSMILKEDTCVGLCCILKLCITFWINDPPIHTCRYIAISIQTLWTYLEDKLWRIFWTLFWCVYNSLQEHNYIPKAWIYCIQWYNVQDKKSINSTQM